MLKKIPNLHESTRIYLDLPEGKQDTTAELGANTDSNDTSDFFLFLQIYIPFL